MPLYFIVNPGDFLYNWVVPGTGLFRITGKGD